MNNFLLMHLVLTVGALFAMTLGLYLESYLDKLFPTSRGEFVIVCIACLVPYVNAAFLLCGLIYAIYAVFSILTNADFWKSPVFKRKTK